LSEASADQMKAFAFFICQKVLVKLTAIRYTLTNSR